MFKRLITLIKYDFLIELRSKYAISGIILYVAIIILLMYLSISITSPMLWLALLLLIILFTALNTIAKSFMLTATNERLYNYQLIKPGELIIAKVIYNFFLLLILTAITLVLFYFVFGIPVLDYKLFFLGLLLVVLSFSVLFTTMSSIAAQTKSSAILMPILSFPVIIPQLLLIMKIMKSAVSDVGDINLTKDILSAILIILVLFSLSYLLFPYIWRD